MKHLTLRALLPAVFAAALLTVSDAAEAGSVLLTRESTIRAEGKDGSTDFALQEGAVDFDGFSDTVDTVDAGVAGPRVSANQNSRPTLDEVGAFAGAYAEGSATVAAQLMDYAEAASAFDLTFEVMGEPSMVSVGGSVGVVGNATTSVSLCNQETGEVVLMQELLASPDGDGRAIDHSKLLDPGVYELMVTANGSGAPDEGMAYYTVSLSLGAADNGGGGGATPVPLPPTVWSAGAVLLAAGAARGWTRLRRRGC